MKKFYFLIITLCFVLTEYESVGQLGPELQLTNPAPLSPNAASIQKFGDVPVGRYTGVPNINIPLYNIQTTHLEVPISLNYHASGVKIEDVASWAGLGWALNAGGVITRNVRGLPDEDGNGYLNTSYLIDQYPTMDSTQLANYYYNISNNYADPMPDIFSFSAGPLSGKFNFRGSVSNIVCIPQSKIKVTYGNFGGQYGFKIVAADGLQYYFLDIEESSSFSSALPMSGEGINMINTWYLTKIISADNKDSIIFEYETQLCVYNSIANVTHYMGEPNDNGCTKNDVRQYSENSVLGKSLKKISFKNGSVLFEADTTERQDLQNAHALKTIKIINGDSTFYKKINFFYSYTTGSNPTFTTNNYLKKRMYLDSLVIMDKLEKQQKYSMDYYDRSNLPGRMSWSQDFWGYYNGASNTGLTPTGIFTLSLISDEFPYYIVPYYGADRTARLNYAQCGSLKSLTYPTGGSSEFIYESNRVYNFYQYLEFGFDQIDTTVSVNLLGDPNGITTTYSKTFSVSRDFGRSGRVIAKINVGLPGASSIPPPPQTSEDPDVKLKLNGTQILQLRYNMNYVLPVGNYEITADFSGNPDSNLIKNFFVNITFDYGVISDTHHLHNIAVGGLRIERILNHENNNTYTRRYEYGDSTISSGILTDVPTFLSFTKECNNANNLVCKYAVFTAAGHTTLSNTQGSLVAYQKVTEYNSANGELGKSVYNYSYWDDLGNFRIFPYPPPCSMDWLRGHLLTEEHFRNVNGVYELAQKKIYNYGFNTAITDSFYTTTKGVKAGKKFFNCDWAGLNVPYASVSTDTRTGWLRLYSDTLIEYSKEQPGQSIITTNAYSYNTKNFEVDTTISSSSVGNPIKTVYRYSTDYQFTTTPVGNRALAIKALTDKNLITAVIEKQVFRKKGSGDVLLNGTLYGYNASVLRPDTVSLLQPFSPVTNFTSSGISNNSLSVDNRYQPKLVYGFDAMNNITEEGKVGDVLQSYVWDYNNSYVISSVIGANTSDIAYTSFEADGTGNWTIGSSLRDTTQGLTGRKSYVLSNGSISRSNLNSNTEYWLTYWKRDTTALSITGTQGTPQKSKLSNGWTCIMHKISGVTSVSISGSGTIDELRIYPKSAQMSTYTYDPLVGVTSQCDISNHPSYYEYDGLGRLKTIRDQENNILKVYTYKYQQPQ